MNWIEFLFTKSSERIYYLLKTICPDLGHRKQITWASKLIRFTHPLQIVRAFVIAQELDECDQNRYHKTS